MSVYNNETKVYLDLNPTAPQEPQSYGLSKVSGIEGFILMKLMFMSELSKK